ncbi:RAQPRD family integrative conjugative element protein [Xanthomonas sp. CFBP 8445]|uniref:integrative conjugative element protein, RAQPRD family n=1 Tax=Xanthomonas sp. CFBP 8445 TaxID=2971236 RepID=UPI0021DFDC84|nr:RAQPRD family integrative conjugative element protein [Xanthomonas sp. CFBP 8445]UYC11898.1 RAQPRD family integrative conjugative element protein [Xanthomonas sp. CFBP 8445]
MTSRATASHAASPRLPLSGVLAAALLCSAASAQADAALERDRLAGAQRLLDQVDRLAATAAPASASEPSRYHFDYARLHDDVRRMQAGFASFLVPVRAQPRDPSALTGQYTRESAPSPAPPEQLR